jgi:hypothetical protein
MVTNFKSLDFILESLVPSLVEPLARLDVEVNRAQFLYPGGDLVFEDALNVWLICEEVRGGGDGDHTLIHLIIEMHKFQKFHLRPEENLLHRLIKRLLILDLFQILNFLPEIVRRNFIEQNTIFTRITETV